MLVDPMPATLSVRLGTRSSALAQWQANWVSRQLQNSGVVVEIVPIRTEGDVNTAPLGEIGGQGVFTKAIQRALLANEIDLAVHSLKDLPTEPIAGLRLAASPRRESPADAFVCNTCEELLSLPKGAKIGTGSARRRAQLLHVRPDFDVAEIRGNVDTRLKKLDDGEYDALILAESGLRRLELNDRIKQVLPFGLMLPAVGQGALGLEIRENDAAAAKALAPLNHAETLAAVTAERAMLRTLRGGCMAPVGVWGRLEDGNKLALEGVVLSQDGRQRIAAKSTAAVSEAESLGVAESLGIDVAQQLLSQGAEALINAAR